MFRTLIYPSSGACDYCVESPHWSYCSWFDVCWSFGVVGLEWRLKPATRIPLQPNHTETPTHRTKNNTTDMVIQQNSRKLLMIDISMSETCWAHKKWNKIASDIKLVFYTSTITMMQGPINIRLFRVSTVSPHRRQDAATTLLPPSPQHYAIYSRTCISIVTSDLSLSNPQTQTQYCRDQKWYDC